MVRRISGKYKANTVSHLKYNNTDITDVKEICNTLAKQFAFNSSSYKYSHMFNRCRLKLEEKKLIFILTIIIRTTMYLRCMSSNKQLKYHVIHHQVVIRFTISYSNIYLMTVYYCFCIFLITFG